MQIVGENAGDFSQHSCLANTGTPEQEDAFTGLNKVLDNAHSTEYRPAYAACQSDHTVASVPYGRNAVQCAFDTCPVVIPKRTDARGNILDIFYRHLGRAEYHLALGEACFGLAAEVEDNLGQVGDIVLCPQRLPYGRGQDIQQGIKVVSYRSLQKAIILFLFIGYYINEILVESQIIG